MESVALSLLCHIGGSSSEAEHGDFLACLFCRRGVVCHFHASSGRRRERGAAECQKCVTRLFPC